MRAWRTASIALVVLACTAGEDTDKVDTDADTDLPPVVVGPVWDWCTVAAGATTTGEATIVASEPALYCATFDERRPDILSERGFKAKLRYLEGSHAVPAVDGTAPFLLPACIAISEDGSAGLMPAGDGTVTTTIIPVGSVPRYQVEVVQPMVDTDGDPWTLFTTFLGDSTPGDLILAGEHLGIVGATQLPISLCEGECGSPEQVRRFDSCHFRTIAPERHTLAFEGGEIVLDYRIGVSFTVTQPALFERAEGTLDGTEWVQEDYWRLLYHPGHHHLTRNAIVLFAEPIGEWCGIEILHFDPWDDPPPTEINLLACDLTTREARAVTASEYEHM